MVSKSKPLLVPSPDSASQPVHRFTLPSGFRFFGSSLQQKGLSALAGRERRRDAEQTARLLLQGGLQENEVFAAADGDTMLDLATHGTLRDYLGRQRRRWRGFADEAHALKARWGREYAAFCNAYGIRRVVQAVVRAPVSAIPLSALHATHKQDSARLGDRIRYARKRFAPGLACDLIAAEVCAIARQGADLDLHFHLAIRANAEECYAMQRYFEASGWSWWDSLTGGAPNLERYPFALAQYASKSLAAAIKQANEDGCPFSPKNLAELHRQTRHMAMTRATGAFRIWKSQLAQQGLTVAENENGHLVTRGVHRRPQLAGPRSQLSATTAIRLLRLVRHDFGDGLLRPALLVRGPESLSFRQVSDVYDVTDAIAAAQCSPVYLKNTSIPESQETSAPTHNGYPSVPGCHSSMDNQCERLKIPW